jgi:hypothetical protein
VQDDTKNGQPKTQKRFKCGQSTNLCALKSKIRRYLDVLARLRELPTSLTSSGPSVGIVRLRTEATEFPPPPKIKNALKGQAFADIQRNVSAILRSIPENDFQDCFRQWHNRLA